jgi:two-component system CheB/CheR fusion protein
MSGQGKNILDLISARSPPLTAGLDGSISGIVITDFLHPDNPIIYCNKAFEELTGYSQEEVLGKNCRFLQANDSRQKGRYELKKALQNGQECHVELVNYRKDGTLFWNELFIAPIHDHKGAITHYIGIQNNVTERKLKGVMLKLQNAQSDKARQLKDEFINAAGHELRTPLTSLKASMQLLSRLMDKDLSSASQQVLLNKANMKLNKLSSLVEDLLQTSKTDASRLLRQYSSFSLFQLVGQVIKDLEFDQKHQISISGNRDVEVTADKAQIEQVIINLLNNAVKYTPAGGSIVVNIEKLESEVKVTIEDSGIGIAEDKLLYIFERYYRGDHPVLNVSGLGLGLFTSREIIKSHDGEIAVSSQEGEGSAFWFTLPQSS